MIELPVLPSTKPADESPRRRFWRSVQQFEGDAAYGAFTNSELMPDAQGSPGETSRRSFLQIMGASMALAGLTACRKPVEAIMPFVRKPEDLIPGVPMQYATGMEFRGTLRPLVVESTDGRPTKVEGNAEHPDATGKSGVFEQAALLGLYDPDRSQAVRRNGDASTWADFVRFVAERPVGRLAVMMSPTSSPTVVRLVSDLAAAHPGTRVVTYDHALAYTSGLRTRYHLDRAKVILSLGRDFLGPADADQLHNTSTFAKGRRADDGADMSRLYCVESGYSITGGMADHRLAIRPSQISAFAAAVARRLGVSAPGSAFDDHPWVEAIADDLRAAGSSAVVVTGKSLSGLGSAMNAALGAWGTTVESFDAGTLAGTDGLEAIQALTGEMTAGSIDTLVLVGVNPVYDLPASMDFAGAMKRVGETIHLGLHVDETARAAGWHLPQTHFLEAWGDGRSFDGTQSVIQPLIAPLYDSAHSAIELLALLAGGTESSGYDLVRETWRSRLSGDFEKAWRKVVHDGFLADSGFSAVAAPAGGSFDGIGDGSDKGLEIYFRPDSKVFDGSFSNNAWLQELPDSVTKIVWDNVAAMSAATAAELGVGVDLTNGKHHVDRIAITVAGQTVDLPVWIVPGMADSTIQVNLGYGREITSGRPERHTNFFDTDDQTDIYGHGAVATGVGVAVSALRNGAGMWVSGASAAKSGSDYLIATTQDHGALPDEGAEAMDRGLFRMATVDEYRANPEFVRNGEPKPIKEDWQDYPALWQSQHPADSPAIKDNPYFANQWGMVIDLNACTGCNACLVACQAENNIQVVGKDQVSRGREMHWIRLDRYFVGDGADGSPQMVVQPVPCMHCENAPCESVCPVAATVHSPDGTNQMIYNRCIGTRYCANNCPYKVRRFNYYNWTKTLPDTVHMAQNPNVTVRSRGVMEKCSYCIQRVREVNKRVNVENRPIRDGEVLTACQQACPADAIVFGDMNDAESGVSVAKRNPRRYELLAELSVKPRTSYLGRIRNPNPRLEAQA